MELTGIFAYPAKVSPETPATIVAWFQGKPMFSQSLGILDFGRRVRGTILASLTDQGTTSVKWTVAVESPEQAKIAAETLAKMLFKTVGVRLAGYQLPDNMAVERAMVM